MRTILRSAALLTAGLLIAPFIESSATAATASPQASASSWLSAQVKSGVIHNDQYAFDDYALTADTAYALSVLGAHQKTLKKVRHTLAAHVDSWTTGADTGSSDVYAGSVAKAAVTADILGANPKKFGGVNLVARLKSLVATNAPIKGRVQDKSSYGDYANVVGQALAARALSVGKSPVAHAAVRFLLGQQCKSGYFRLDLAAATAADQTCAGGDKATTSAPDTDTTALTLISLLALPHRTHAVKTSIAKARRWLLKHQATNGSFGGGLSTEAANANSTGLAGYALGELGSCTQAKKAARWVTRLQVSKKAKGTALASQKGAIAYDRVAYAAAATTGITADGQDQWRRATSQGALVLADLPACSR